MLNKTKRPVVLVFARYYLPGYKAGGPIRTISNMVEALGDDVEFYIVSSDRDLGDTKPYDGVQVGKWNSVGKAQVYYLGPDQFSFSGLRQVIKSKRFDFFYLNSFFDPVFTLSPVLLRYFRLVSSSPTVIAPRGEFSPGALQLKKFKKSIFLRCARLFRFFHGVTWQASTESEAADIYRAVGSSVKGGKVLIARNVPASITVGSVPTFKEKTDSLRVCFLARISRMKNLDFAIAVLASVRTKVDFDVYGPIEDEGYWDECSLLVHQLPENVSFTYRGSVEHSQVANVISGYDLFFVPSRGENFGHVFMEALSVGVPILVSDKTPWRDLKSRGLGWDLALNEKKIFVEAIEEACSWNVSQMTKIRSGCIEFATEKVRDAETLRMNKKLFGLI